MNKHQRVVLLLRELERDLLHIADISSRFKSTIDLYFETKDLQYAFEMDHIKADFIACCTSLNNTVAQLNELIELGSVARITGFQELISKLP